MSVKRVVKEEEKGKKLGDELQIEKGVGPLGKRRFGMGGGGGGWWQRWGMVSEGWGGPEKPMERTDSESKLRRKSTGEYPARIVNNSAKRPFTKLSCVSICSVQ